MNSVFKIFKYSLLLIISVSVILISLSYILQNRVAEVILKSINNNIPTKVDVGTFKLSLLRKFPKASLELKDVFILSSSGVNSGNFSNVNTDTLLIAANISLDFNFADIINGRYDIERIVIRKGKVSIFTDTAGIVNYRISDNTIYSGNSNLTLNLNSIILSDIIICYSNQAHKILFEGKINNGRLRSRLSGDNMDLKVKADISASRIRMNNISITRSFSAGLELEMENSKNGILVRKGELYVETFRFTISGSASAKNYLNIDFKGENIELSKLKLYLPEKYLTHLREYNPAGDLNLDCHITGLLTNSSNPHVELNCVLNNGSLENSKSGLILDRFSFNGSFSNGPKNNLGTSSVSLNDIKAKIRSSELSGMLKLEDFENPLTNIQLKGSIYPGELKELFGTRRISSASGSFDIDLRFETGFRPDGDITIDDIVNLQPEGSLFFNSLTIGLIDSLKTLTDVNGEMTINKSFISNNLSFKYRGQQIGFGGEVRNLPEWLAGHPVKLKVDADISFDRLIPETIFFKDNTPEDTVKNNTAISMPTDLMLDINYKIDSLSYKSFKSSEITGTLNYNPGIMTFKSFYMKSLTGLISGNGFIARNKNKTYVARGDFNISKINIRKTFETFHNFGQDFLKSENLDGSLSGTLSILVPMDSMMQPQINSLVGEGRYTVTDGSLINFEPVKELSAFIELSELENIRFEELKNDFYIRNNLFTIPQMEVNSSAANLTINGKHSFENDYEYHIKVLLSEILSKKRKKTKCNITETGVIEDDGLGRTSMLLKIENKGEDVKVSYDVKAAGNKVKSSLKSERQSLKAILNQEYGWYKADTVSTTKPAVKKKRFRISWEENDTLIMERDPEKQKMRMD